MASKNQNTPGLGIEFEVHVPALFALLLNKNPEVKDFKLQSNVQGFENLDDLLVDIETKSGENLYFAFQLKHTEKSSKNLLPANLEAKGNFTLQKYCKAFKKLKEDIRKKYHFILYSNRNFDNSRTNEVKKFDMKHDDCSSRRNFFDTSGNDKNLYKFEVNEETEDGEQVSKQDYQEFFSKFSVYTGQANAIGLEKSILEIIKYGECAKYIDFFRKWHRGDFVDKIIDKKTLNVHLVDILLSPVAIKYHFSDGQDENLNFFEAMVQQFDITILDAPKQDFIKQLEEDVHKYPERFNKNSEEKMKELAKMNKLIDRWTEELKEETKLKLLQYFYQKPLILDFNESSKDLIYEASKLCRIEETREEIGIKLVLMGKDIDMSKFSHLKIFKNVTDVNEQNLEEIKRKCNLTLQGRNISLGEICEDEILEFVTPVALFQMLKGSFSIGEEKVNLPQYYIPRTVSAKVFDIESILKHSNGSLGIIFYYEGKFEKLKNLVQGIVDREDYLYEDLLDCIILKKKQFHQDNSSTFPEIPTIILKKEECSSKQFDEICEKLRKEEQSRKESLKKTFGEKTKSNKEFGKKADVREDVHLFQVVDAKTCLLLKSTKNTSFTENYKSTKRPIEEKQIHVFFNKPINILCAQPGMGKSTLMKYLKNECDPSFCTVMIDLKAHNQFLKKDRKIKEVLKHFIKLEESPNKLTEHIRAGFLRKNKIAFFLDGVDEVEHKCVDRVLEISKLLGEMGFRIWLTSRQNLKQTIEEYFKIFTIEINELNEDQQKNYIENMLKLEYNRNEIKKIVDFIFSNTDLINNRQILEIPLQLHIITQIFLGDNKSYYSNMSKNNNFTLTKMLKIFFDGKYKHYLDKVKMKNHHLVGSLKKDLKNYKIVALHSVLDDDHFQKLNIEKPKLTDFRNWDFLGVITEVNKENKAVFEHLTYAEYFASKFLVKNFNEARILKDEIFSEKYQNLFLIFNIMLAEANPLHLAIIYKDLNRSQELMKASSEVDNGGRNFLQVAACVATRHPPLNTKNKSFSDGCLVRDIPVQHLRGDDSTMKEIVNLILSSGEPFKKDKIFDWNSLDYALATGALYIVEAILEKFEKPHNFFKMLGKYYIDEIVAYYSIRFGYPRLLSEILAQKSCHTAAIVTDCLYYKNRRRVLPNYSILHLNFFFSEYTNRTRIAELLTGDNINKIVDNKGRYTFLHFAVIHEDTKFIKFLLEKKANLNVKDIDAMSPLFHAVQQNNLEISKLLVENGADVNNIKDFYGKTPLFYAVNLEISKFLVEKGADVNIADKKWKSPLFYAVEGGNFEISKWLIEKGADVNIENIYGQSPLFYAVTRDNVKISQLLIEKGAIVNIKDTCGQSPLFDAVTQQNLEILKLLVEKGADFNIKNTYGQSPLFNAVNQDNLESSQLLVEKGAIVNIKDTYGQSPLFYAVKRDNLEISKLLVEKGADVYIQVEEGRSPLFYAVGRNNLEISELLVEKGVDVNIKDTYGQSPLFYAVKRDNLKISQLLVEKGADVNIKDIIYGESPLFYAVKDKNEKPFYGLKRKNLEILKLLFENGADVNITDQYGKSPLFYAVEGNKIEISKLLVENGAHVNIIKDEFGRPPLFYAVERNNLKISKLLVEKGADVNIKDENEWSSLFYAVVRDNLEISKLLVEKGADVNSKDNINGKSPLFYAVERNNLKISKLLVEKRADVNIKDKNGKSPMFYAVERNNFEISKLLVENGADDTQVAHN